MTATAREATSATASAAKTGNRFKALNEFVDSTQRELSRSEMAVWFTLYRDTRPDGIARTSHDYLARRAGISTRQVSRAIDSLARRSLLKRVRRGSYFGISAYRVFGLPH